MRSVLPFDELNSFIDRLKARYPDGKLPPLEEAKKEKEDIIDEMLDLFLLAYAMGNSVTNENLASNYSPSLDEVMETVDKKVAGKTWRERTEEYFADGGSVGDLIRIAETETHRDANEAALRTAVRGGATSKTWVCQMLPTSRDTHIYLDGTTVPIDGYFYSFKGGKTQFPGEWGIAEEDCNCLCTLSFS